MSVAVRVDGATGVEERLEHVFTPRGQLYSWAARPPAATAAVVVCSSILGDFTSNYHRERLLGLALAQAGIGAIRFHYAGEGNSMGERADLTFGSMCADTEAVLDHARTLGFTRLALLGTRMGALVAAASAASRPEIPLALWEPTANPLAFIREARRAQKISQVAQAQEGSRLDWREELATKGVLDLVGYDVYPALIESLENINLLDLIGDHPRPIFVARFKKIDTDPLTEALTEKGFPVTKGVVDVSEAWWFHSELISSSGDLIGTSARWLEEVLRGGTGSS